MKKNLLAIGLLAIGYSVQAQTETVLLHVDDAAKMYVSEGTLVYNGGGLQTKGGGIIDLHGNMMIVGGSTDDTFRTINNGGTDKTDGSNIILRLNTPSSTGSAFATSTYGQLYVTGMEQGKVRAIVDKEYKDISHGSFQQMALPFSGKTIQSVATNLGKASNFTNNRTTTALAYWDNTNTVMRVANPSNSTDPGNNTALYGPTTYFAVGTSGWNPAPSVLPTDVLAIKGMPYSDAAAGTNNVVLSNGGKPGGVPIAYGSGGQNLNTFNERYYSYLNDPFDTRWTSTYGKELYQFGNPFLTNLDLNWIGTEITETGVTKDGNRLPVQGIRYSQTGVNYSSTTGTTTTVNSIVTFINNGANGSSVAAGDVNKLIIKPMGSIYIKLDPVREAANPSIYSRNLNFNTLRRFSNTARAAATSYSVTAAKNGNATLKQLGVIALDNDNKEISRTYYVVHADATTGYVTSSSLQANLGYNSNNTPSTGAIYTNEEYITGGADPTYASQYNLYINEANEVNFLHKRIPMKLNSNAISKLKFEIRENAVLLPDNQSALSAGESFWIKLNGSNVMISQNQVIDAASQTEAGLYYGEPAIETVLGTSENIKKSATIVAYEKATDNFVVIFDKGWKTADIVIYDMSGKLINSEKKVNTTSNHTLSIPRNLNNGYLITIKSDSGEVYNTKVMR
jgi:hypothetical protein